MKKIIFLFLLISSLTLISAKPVIFNGEFREGNILYSQWYYNVSYIYGKDVYPIRGVQYCEIQKKCVAYNYHYYNQCLRFNSFGRCISYKKVKILDDCKTFRNYMICRNTLSYPAICYNPSGTISNQLTLAGNFFYTLDEIIWNQVNYGETYLNNSNVKFKVIIPSNCKPKYNINDAISLGDE